MPKHLIKSKTPKVYKNKKLNSADFDNYNLNEYQVFLHLVTKLGKVDELGRYTQSDELQREHCLSAKEFATMFDIPLNKAYGVIKQACKKLMKTSVTLQKPELFETWEINVCRSAQYKHNEGKIIIRFTEEIMPYLSQVNKKFVLYNLKEISNFGSLYTTRLYELIQEFKDTGLLIKSVEQLRNIFAVGKKFSLYSDFKRYTFGHAVDEINSQYELNLNFEEVKEGRKVVAIKFSFIPTFIRKSVDPKTGKEKNIYLKPKKKTIKNKKQELIKERDKNHDNYNNKTF